MNKKILIASALSLVLAGCAGSQSEPPSTNMDPCKGLRTLADSYQRQFADMRGQRRSFDRINIWRTNFQLVGHGCEIWGWQGGNYNYVCNYVAPNQNVATQTYQDAQQVIKQCLGDEWSFSEVPRQDGVGKQSLFKLPGFAAVVDLRLVETRGISTPRWAVYLMFGDLNDQI